MAIPSATRTNCQGFTFGGKTWRTDPLQADSNLDGIDDAAEWNPAWVASQPDTLDLDGDGVPNPWDDDNDGDGVPDGLDNSPYKVLDYQSSYNITVTKPTNSLHQDTYVYIDLLGPTRGFLSSALPYHAFGLALRRQGPNSGPGQLDR